MIQAKAIRLLLNCENMKTLNVTLINQLVKEYKSNPNCWPDLWIQSEGLDIDEEKEFIKLCLN